MFSYSPKTEHHTYRVMAVRIPIKKISHPNQERRSGINDFKVLISGRYFNR